LATALAEDAEKTEWVGDGGLEGMEMGRRRGGGLETEMLLMLLVLLVLLMVLMVAGGLGGGS
jgi:hypothetical protein